MAGPDGKEYLSEEQAHALWRRAAQLQADAADRQDDRTRLLAGAGDPADTAIRVTDVETAGAEAGIAPEFIRLARAETIASGSRPLSPRMDRAATRILGTDRRVIEISRTLSAAPRHVLEAIGRVFPGNPYYLNLVETLGEPGDGGVMVFDVTRRNIERATSFSWNMLIADITQILVMVRPSSERENATELVLVASLNYARKLNLGVATGLSGAAGIGGGLFGAAVGVGVLGLGALAVLPAAAVAAGAVGITVGAIRPLYRWGLRKGTRGLEGLVRAIDLRLRTGGMIPLAGTTDEPEP